MQQLARRRLQTAPFPRPERFAIWDSNVARVFAGLKPTQVNTLRHWKTYQSTVRGWVDDEVEVQGQIEALRQKIVILKAVKELRIVEMVLFHAGRGAISR